MYDIRPGNGAGLFLQPQRPHGALAGLISGRGRENEGGMKEQERWKRREKSSLGDGTTEGREGGVKNEMRGGEGRG